uniref:Uncharacterized protein n=1 Tax=Arundo donax TaxID=35708 RepID=A0A0A9E5F4_ARUDO
MLHMLEFHSVLYMQNNLFSCVVNDLWRIRNFCNLLFGQFKSVSTSCGIHVNCLRTCIQKSCMMQFHEIQVQEGVAERDLLLKCMLWHCL